MRCKLAYDKPLPGGYSISAENGAEVLALRMFCNDRTPIYIASSGGNIGEGVFDMLIMHKPPEQDQEIIEWLREENERLRTANARLRDQLAIAKTALEEICAGEKAWRGTPYWNAAFAALRELDADGHGDAVPLRDGEG